MVLFLNSSYDRSLDLVAVGRGLSAGVTELLDVSDQDLRSNSYLNYIVLSLRDQHSYLLTELMRLSDDILGLAPILKVILSFSQCLDYTPINIHAMRS